MRKMICLLSLICLAMFIGCSKSETPLTVESYVAISKAFFELQQGGGEEAQAESDALLKQYNTSDESLSAFREKIKADDELKKQVVQELIKGKWLFISMYAFAQMHDLITPECEALMKKKQEEAASRMMSLAMAGGMTNPQQAAQEMMAEQASVFINCLAGKLPDVDFEPAEQQLGTLKPPASVEAAPAEPAQE